MLATLLAFAFTCGIGATLSLRAADRRPRRRCLSCRQLLVCWNGELFQCRGCGAEYFSAGESGLIPKEAWLSGARERIPSARLVR